MLRLLALSLLTLAAPYAAVADNSAAAEQVHPCQAQTPPCSLAMAQARHYLDELDRNAGNFVAPPLVPPPAAEQVHPCQAQTPPCSLELAQARHYSDELDRLLNEQAAPKARKFGTGQIHPCQAETPPCQLWGAVARREHEKTKCALAETNRALEALDRRIGPGTTSWAAYQRYRSKPRYVPVRSLGNC